MTDLACASWNVTQFIRNALTSLPSLRNCAPYDDYDLNEDLDHLESDLEAALARAQNIIQRIETLTEGKKNESN